MSQQIEALEITAIVDQRSVTEQEIADELVLEIDHGEGAGLVARISGDGGSFDRIHTGKSAIHQIELLLGSSYPLVEGVRDGRLYLHEVTLGEDMSHQLIADMSTATVPAASDRITSQGGHLNVQERSQLTEMIEFAQAVRDSGRRYVITVM